MKMAEQLTVTLSPELSEKVRAQAASHGYTSESEFIEDNIAEAVEPESQLEQWLKTVGIARYDAYDANPNDVLTEDELLGYVQQRLQRLHKAG